MSTSFNPYQVWLGLAEGVTDPNHFQLLGLDETEENAKAIAAAADRAASRVRRCRPGEHAKEWAALLDQISAVKACLIDPKQRSEYMRSTGVKSTGTKSAGTIKKTPSSPSAPPRGKVDPNMYPPGFGPAMAPVSQAAAPAIPATTPAEIRPREDSHADSWAGNPPLPPSAFEPIDPQPVPANAFPPPGVMPLSPAGVPYLQPADSGNMADPMRPLAPGITDPYSLGMSPMAPPASMNLPPSMPLPPASIPMAAVPMQIPGGMVGIPMAQPLSPNAAYPMAAAFPAPPVAREPSDSFLSVTNTAMPTNRSRGGLLGPSLMGLVAGLALLALGFGYFYFQNPLGKPGSNPVASEDGATENGATENGAVGGAPQDPSLQDATPVSSDVRATETGTAPASPTKESKPDKSSTEKGVTEKQPDDKAADSKPATETQPISPPPSAAKPTEPTKPDSKPVPETKPAPATETPTKTEELPKPTKEELTKLGRAMQKTRETIGIHEFDKAEAFLSLTADMPRLPEHQAMLDRLKLLLNCVRDYRQAIQSAIAKLAIASSFEVGTETVIVVETSPEKVTFRTKGQNRSYTIRELPVGLAVALAAQSLADDDPKTLTLKGAYILASPKVTPSDLEKARSFLDKASGSNDDAKELLRLFDDKYDLAGAAK